MSESTREICFDTETTGLNAHQGDRIIELGAIELIDRLPTGRHFHTFLDPGPQFVELHAKVTEITGYTIDKVRGQPVFADQVEAFLNFIGDSPLVAHNADFDKSFINAELERLRRDPLPNARFIDTLKIARAKFPGSPASLDALCRRFDVSLSARDTHGALIDSQLLAEVYLHLRGGRERKLGLAVDIAPQLGPVTYAAKPRPTPLPGPSEDEFATHKTFIAAQKGDMIWEKLWAREAARSGDIQ
jgi:DNA polymerase-3 subunit epsilon